MNAVWGQLLSLCLGCCFLLPSGHIILIAVFLPLQEVLCSGKAAALSVFQPPASDRARVSCCWGCS